MEQIKIKSLLLTGVITLAASMFAGCTEYADDPAEFTTENIVINYTDSVIDASISSRSRTRSVSECTEISNSVLTSKTGKELYLTCTETPWPVKNAAITRGTKVTTAGISSMGVSASVYGSSTSYTSAGCGSYFYKESVASGTPTRFYWPTSDYKISFFGYYPYNNAAFTVQSAASATGAPTYAYTVPSAISSQQDIMTGQVVDRLGGSASSVNMTLSHRCSALRFSVTNERSESVTINTISIEGVKYTGTLSGSIWTLGSGVNSSSTNPFSLTCNTTVAAGATVDITGSNNMFLMLPQTLPAGAKLKMTTDDDEFEANLTGTWVQSNSYSYSIIVSEDDFIDLGLPSGLLWATRNLGASRPREAGLYFSWGNIEGHAGDSEYNFDETDYSLTSGYLLTYNIPANSTYDAARAIRGSNWRLPTRYECQELIDNTNKQWTTVDGVSGYKFTKKSDNSVFIFMPAARFKEDGAVSPSLGGRYWSSSKYNDTRAYRIGFSSSDSPTVSWNLKSVGFSIRPVFRQIPEYVDLGLSSGTLWATCNIGARSPEDLGVFFSWGNVDGHASGDGYNFSTDYSNTLGSKLLTDIPNNETYDAARADLGGHWRLPTYEDLDELLNECTWSRTTLNGVTGYRFVGPNTNSIFIPLAGYINGSTLTATNAGYYWASTMRTSGIAWGLYIGNSGPYIGQGGGNRVLGFPIRPVTEE